MRGSKKLAGVVAAAPGAATAAAIAATVPAATEQKTDADATASQADPGGTDPATNLDPDAQDVAAINGAAIEAEIVAEVMEIKPQRRIAAQRGRLSDGDNVPLCVNGKFRTFVVGMAADISPEFAEVIEAAGLTIEDV